jgi:pimeloyl-ACP methyl ester carboxylesterase
MIGYTFAATRPEQLSGLVTLGAPTPQTFSFGERLLRVEVTRLITPVMGNERLMSAFQWVMERVFSDSSTVDMDDIERIRETHSCDDTEMDSTERAKMMRGVQDYIGSSVDWQSVNIPVLAMYGEDEPFVEQHAEFVRERIGECRVEKIPDASHNSHIDNAEFIIEHTRKFLDDVSAERRPAATE